MIVLLQHGVVILRVVAFLVGALALWGSLFLYPNEMGVVQSRLEDLWDRLQAMRNLAMARQVAIAQATVSVVGAWLDRLFGTKVVSPHAFAVGVLLSYASSLLVFMTTGFPWTWVSTNDVAFFRLMLLAASGMLIGVAMLPLLGRLWPWIVAFQFVLAGLFTILLSVWMAEISGLHAAVWDVRIQLSTFLAVALSAGAAVTVVAIVRYLFRQVARASAFGPLVVSLGVSVVSIAVLVGLPIWARSALYFPNPWGAIVDFFISLNFLAVVPPGLVALVAATLMVHLVLWPSILRPLYTLKQLRVLHRHRGKLAAFGGYVMACAIWPELATRNGILGLIGVHVEK